MITNMKNRYLLPLCQKHIIISFGVLEIPCPKTGVTNYYLQLGFPDVQSRVYILGYGFLLTSCSIILLYDLHTSQVA